jgi:hypothetical protein
VPEAANNQGIQQIAQSLGMEFPLKINHLHDRESAVTVRAPRQATRAGLVEFSGRASAGFPRD